LNFLSVDVRPIIERFPLREASRARETMMNGALRFRAVLDVASARRLLGRQIFSRFP
jgi:D-arabinose 1-dehydrogenase-like Zn-dependent alcohol dehydrogenase